VFFSFSAVAENSFSIHLMHKLEEVPAGWNILHNEELHNLYAPLNIIRAVKSRRMRWEGHVALTEEIRNAYEILVGKPQGKRPCMRYSCRWEDSNRMDLREVEWEVVEWMNVA
jgi:uncharacterized protein YbdZ (MbtH family)